MSFPKRADCIRRAINNSSSKEFYKFDKRTFNADKIKKHLPINSPKLLNLIEHIKELDDNDYAKYGKKFKHIIYSDVKNSLSGIKLVAAVFKAYGMNNIYDEKFNITIPERNDNFALLSSVAIYDKPFPVRLRNKIIEIFNSRPDNIYGEMVRFLLIDQGFKEGIDVYDVKYVHLFDELLTPADEKQAIGRGTRLCGQKGLEFHPELGWPLHIFKYKLALTEELKTKYEISDGFSLFLKESKIDIKKLYFAAELENICRFGAVDYEINRAIHEFGNETEDNLELPAITTKIENFQTFKLRDIYSSLNRDKINEFDIVKKAYNNFGGAIKKKIGKKTKRFIDIKKVKPIEKVLIKKLGFIDMRKYIRKYFKSYKWTNIKFSNGCIEEKKEAPVKRIVDLTNSQLFVSNFFTAESSYKGILFWHSVGTGKTCSAVATASNTFEKAGYTILWVTRHTLKPDIWKNIYKQVCSITIKEKLEQGINIPSDVKLNPLKYLDDKWIMPISYKQFSNLITGKNAFYNELVKRNGKEDPLNKTLIIIDEAHKLFAEDTPVNERPNINILRKAIYHSYKSSKKDSCKLLLMTATPYTNDPIQLFKLLNLLKEDDYFQEDFNKFKDEYLDDDYKFKENKNKDFLDKISGYISYLNRERDVRQFAYPVVYIRNIMMSSNKDINKESSEFYLLFLDDIKDFVKVSIPTIKEIITYLKLKLKANKATPDIITQEEAFKLCYKDKKEETDEDNDNKILKKIVSELNETIKEQELENKRKEKEEKERKKAEEKARKAEEKEKKKQEKEEKKGKKKPKEEKPKEERSRTKKQQEEINIGSLSSFKTLYDVLEIDPFASFDDIKKAYRKLAIKYHPDKNPDNVEAERRIRSINQAYFILKDNKYRKYYDLQMGTNIPLKQIVSEIEFLIKRGRL